jgi:hypothetical protein
MFKKGLIFVIFLFVLTFSGFSDGKTSFYREQYILSYRYSNYDFGNEFKDEIEMNIKKIREELDQNWYAPFEMIGWSRTGLFSYRYGSWIDAMPGWAYCIVILNTITDEIIEKDVIYLHAGDDKDQDFIEDLKNRTKNKWNEILKKHNITGTIENPISNNYDTNLLRFPVDNFSCWFDYTIIKSDEWGEDIIEWKLKIGNNSIQKIIGGKSERIQFNIDGRKILGYYRSPYENRIVIIVNYFFTYFGPGGGLDLYGCNMNVGLGG